MAQSKIKKRVQLSEVYHIDDKTGKPVRKLDKGGMMPSIKNVKHVRLEMLNM